ncbi:hypothetical protein ACOSP7_011517 [Xanthoceras sorbifolium]
MRCHYHNLWLLRILLKASFLFLPLTNRNSLYIFSNFMHAFYISENTKTKTKVEYFFEAFYTSQQEEKQIVVVVGAVAADVKYMHNWGERAPTLMIARQKSSRSPKLETIAEEGYETCEAGQNVEIGCQCYNNIFFFLFYT